MYVFASSICLEEIKIPPWLCMRADQCFLTSSREKQRPSQGLILCNRNPILILIIPRYRTPTINRSRREKSLHSVGYLFVSPPGSSGYILEPAGIRVALSQLVGSQKPRTRTNTKKETQALKDMNVGKQYVKRQWDERVGGGRTGVRDPRMHFVCV